jgi:hypothetical protein
MREPTTPAHAVVYDSFVCTGHSGAVPSFIFLKSEQGGGGAGAPSLSAQIRPVGLVRAGLEH